MKNELKNSVKHMVKYTRLERAGSFDKALKKGGEAGLMKITDRKMARKIEDKINNLEEIVDVD